MSAYKSAFLFRPTPVECQALDALKAVREQAGRHHSPGDIYAASVADKRLEAFKRLFHVKERRADHCCLARLLGKRRCPDRHPYAHGNSCNAYNILPAADHLSEWVTDTHSTYIVSQPYDWSWETMAATVDCARLYRFHVRLFSDLSWHFPGRTILALYAPEGE